MSTLSIAPAADVHVPAQRRPAARLLVVVPDAGLPVVPALAAPAVDGDPLAGASLRVHADPVPDLDRGHLHRPPGHDRVAGAPVRLTRRGRLVAVVAFLALALGVMTALGGWATATQENGVPEPVRMVEVAPGDTLYGIAGEIAEPGEVREMVHRIQELNSLPGAQISEGQKLAVPRG